MKYPVRVALACLMLCGFAVRPVAAFESAAQHVYVVEAETGTPLYEKAAEDRIPTASMSKMMTAYVVFEQLKAGKLKLDDDLPVSEAAWRTGLKDRESKMFVPIHGRVKVEDLLRGMIIQSGNDACVVLAEGVGGSIDEFARMMNDTAKRIGLTGSHFTNPHGLPDPDHYSTAHDLATLGLRLIEDFPEYYHYFSEIDFTFNGIKQGNRNPLLYETDGADGIKTGHTEELGFSLTGSVKRGDRRIIFVMTGLPSMKARREESDRIAEFAFREWQNYQLVKVGDVFDQADVWLGVAPKVPLVASKALMVTLPRAARKDLRVTISYNSPIPAPVTAGTEIGTLTATVPDRAALTVPLVTGGAVDRLGTFGRMSNALDYMIWHGKS